MEKQAYALVQSLKRFKIYIRNSRIIVFLPHPAVKGILGQQHYLDRRGNGSPKFSSMTLIEEEIGTEIGQVTYKEE